MADDDDSPFTPGVVLRLQYACYLFFGLLATMLIRGTLGKTLNSISVLQKGCAVASSTVLRENCTGEMIAYRVSFSLAVFFFLHWLSVSDLTCCVRSRSRVELQRSFFYFKSALLVLFLFMTFWIPNSFFSMYAYVCLFASAIFLLINVVFLVDFSYHWSDSWGERADHNIKWMWYLLGVALGSFALAVGVNVASFILFVPHSDCNFNAFSITSTLVAALLYTVLSVIVPHGSIVPSGIVFLYTSTILLVALRTRPDEYCNRLGTSGNQSQTIKQMLLSSLSASFTLGYAVVSSGGSGAALNVGQDEEGEDEDPDETGHLSHYMFFYFVMMMGSMYLAMLATGWHVSGDGDKTLVNSINVAFWVRQVTVWIAAFLYTWTLAAPYTCCKGRNFGFEVDNDGW